MAIPKVYTSVDPSSLDFDHHECATHNNISSAMDLLLRTISVKSGFALWSWCSILGIEISKKYGVFDIDKMRLIQVMYVVFQINNEWLGKRVIELVEALKEIASGQYGCHKHHWTNLYCLNKILVFNCFCSR